MERGFGKSVWGECGGKMKILQGFKIAVPLRQKHE